MSNYYAKQGAKVRIAQALNERGWKIYGFKEDESDMMTDYYSPAHWDGIAEKNGFILVIDKSCDAEPYEIKKYNYTKVSNEDKERIKKLEAMTQANGATAGEEQNAKSLIEKIMAKSKIDNKPEYEIVGIFPGYMANPGKCKWHIEKDGKIYDKGTGITKYDDMPSEWQYDILKMEFKEGYQYYNDWENGQRVSKKRELNAGQEKIIYAFKSLILRFERVVNGINTMGDGTAETEQAGLEQQNENMEKVIKKVTKKVLKMIPVERNFFKEGDYITLPHHGHYWKITKEYMQKGIWKGVQEEKKAFVYEIVGSESRGYKPLKNATSYYNYEFRMLKDLEEGKIKIYELKEVEEIQEVEKWVKTKKEKTNNNSQTKINQEETNTNELTINTDIDTRDNSPIWVVKINTTLTKDKYKKVADDFKKLNGYYSKFKHGFIFKYDPSEALQLYSVK